jgi:hypothetical protein
MYVVGALRAVMTKVAGLSSFHLSHVVGTRVSPFPLEPALSAAG